MKLVHYCLGVIIWVLLGYFSSFVSEHPSAMTVTPFSANLGYHSLIPPSEGVLHPWILAIRESQYDCHVKRSVAEELVFDAPHSF
jgi:hypothetical protein